MSTTNPAEFNVEILLKCSASESCRTVASNHHEGAGPRESLRGEARMEQILGITSDLERQTTAGTLDCASALHLVVARTLPLIAASGAAIGLVEGQEVVCCATAGTAPDMGARIRIEEGLSGECIRSGRVVRSDDTMQDLRLDKVVCQALSMRSAMAVPIRFAGKVIGVFEVFSAEPYAFDDWAELAISQLADFIAGIVNADITPPEPAAAAGAALPTIIPAPALPAESSGKLERGRPPRSSHRWRVALLMMAALATAVVAVSYRVRDMIRNTRTTHRAAEISPPALPSSGVGEAATPMAPLSSEPAIAREDGRVAAGPDAVRPPAGWHRRTATAPTRSPIQTKASSSPPPLTSAANSEPPRKLEVAPNPPALTAVQPATQREAVIGPLLNVPVTDPKLADQQTTPPAEAARPGKARFVSRVLGKPKKLKVLVEKNSSNQPKPTRKTSGDKPEPQSAAPSTQSP